MEPIVQGLIPLVKQHHASDHTGHGWWHVHRVWRLAIHIAERDGADPLAVQLAALLHDADDRKFFPPPSGGPQHPHALRMLGALGADPDLIQRVDRIIAEVPFKGAGVATKPTSPEGCVVQDADRLDALGALGIARTFAYGGALGRAMHDPALEPIAPQTHPEYPASHGTTINHFHQKLLLIADRLNTPTARAIATGRHAFLVQFLERFMAEWDGADW